MSSQTPDDPDTTTGPNSATDTKVNVVGQADLAVTLDADHSANSSNPALAGANVAYTATVTNNGPSDNTAYTVTFDNLPAGTTFVSAPGCTNNSGSVVCTSTATLAPGSSDSYTLTLKIDPSFADAAPAAGVTLSEAVTLSGLAPS